MLNLCHSNPLRNHTATFLPYKTHNIEYQLLTNTTLDVDKQNCKLNVPEESIDAYKQAPVWKEFSIITGVSGIDEVVTDSTTKVQVFNLSGTRVPDSLDNLPAGIYIVRQGVATKKVVIR